MTTPFGLADYQWLAVKLLVLLLLVIAMLVKLARLDREQAARIREYKLIAELGRCARCGYVHDLPKPIVCHRCKLGAENK